MKVEIVQETFWKRALNAARKTVGKEPLDKEPSDKWKDSILYAEHSPIRQVEYDIQMEGIPNFVSVHLVRHHEGCEKFVHSNREAGEILFRGNTPRPAWSHSVSRNRKRCRFYS